METENRAAERALLVSLDTGDFDAQVSLEELAELARSRRGRGARLRAAAALLSRPGYLYRRRAAGGNPADM